MAFNSKVLKRVIILLLALIALAFLIFNENGLLKYLKVKNELNELEQEIKSSEQKLKKLESEIDSLKNSKVKKEKVAREKFDMMKKNERVFRIKEN
jgi:cell division protein FtsB